MASSLFKDLQDIYGAEFTNILTSPTLDTLFRIDHLKLLLLPSDRL